MKRIEDVRVERQMALVENFRKKGLPELLKDVKFSIDPTESHFKIVKKFISAVKRTFKKDYFSRSEVEQLNYFNNISIHPLYRVKVTKLSPEEGPELYTYIRKLLYYCQPKPQLVKEEDVIVVRIQIKNGHFEDEGYAILNGETKGSYHRTKRYITKQKKYGPNKIFDMSTLIAETILLQSLVDFSEKNKELVKYLTVRKFSTWQYGPKVPISAEFKKDYLEIAAKYNFDLESAVESEVLERERDNFYMDKQAVGSGTNPFHDSLIELTIAEFIKEAEYAIYKTNEEFNDRSEYAKSFETKKQIKKTHEEKMKNNVFLSKYGYVELDNDVDLEKFKIIEENFIELCKELYIPNRKDYSFRIKKLGKHRAAGIFFPSKKTTIFDLSHPGAYVHELMHQFDYILAEGKREDYYSETIEFRAIYDEYVRLITMKINSLPKEDEFRKQWEGKTKYNKLYYFKPTEVFARSGEVYVALKGIENSLAKTRAELEIETVYTFEDSFTNKVIKFFDKLMSGQLKKVDLQQETENDLINVKTTPFSLSKNYKKMEPVKYEQLTLF